LWTGKTGSIDVSSTEGNPLDNENRSLAHISYVAIESNRKQDLRVDSQTPFS